MKIATLSQDLYDMNLHEEMIFIIGHIEWRVIRVASGWMYSKNYKKYIFVPFDNKFQKQTTK